MQAGAMEEDNKKKYEAFSCKDYKEKKLFLLLESKLDCSFIFESGSSVKTLSSHKWMLSAVSPVFEKMFNGDFKESVVSSMDIKIEDISCKDFELCLDFIYYNRTHNWHEESWEGLQYIAKKYMIKKLEEELNSYIRSTGDIIPSFIWMKTNNLSFTKAYNNKILTDPRLGKLDFQEFMEFTKFVGIELVYGCYTIDFFKLLEAYFKQKGYNLSADQPDVMIKVSGGDSKDDDGIEKSAREVFRTFCDLIDFRAMSLRQLLDLPINSNFLPTEEKHQILVKHLQRLLPRQDCRQFFDKVVY